MTKQILNKEIYEAFNIKSAYHYENKKYEYENGFLVFEAQQVREFFDGKHWKDVTLKRLKAECQSDISACLSFMPDEAKCYFLPSYLLICINNIEECDFIYDSTISRLTKRNKHFAFINLTTEQKKVVMHVLEYFATVEAEEDDYEAKEALSSYWEQF